MILSGNEIKKQKMIDNAVSNNFRSVSYDLTIGSLIDKDYKLVNEYILKPRGMIKIISAERVKISAQYMGLVHVKTGLCNEGILPLNIGIVDPGYDGNLTSTLINFGKHEQRLSSGDVFGRLTIHVMQSHEEQFQKNVVSNETAIKDAKNDVSKNLGDTFLDLENVATEISDKTIETYKKKLLFYVPGFALLLAFITVGITFGNMWIIQKYMEPESKTRAEIIKVNLDEKLSKLTEQNADLTRQIEYLSGEFKQMQERKKKKP